MEHFMLFNNLLHTEIIYSGFLIMFPTSDEKKKKISNICSNKIFTFTKT